MIVYCFIIFLILCSSSKLHELVSVQTKRKIIHSLCNAEKVFKHLRKHYTKTRTINKRTRDYMSHCSIIQQPYFMG